MSSVIDKKWEKALQEPPKLEFGFVYAFIEMRGSRMMRRIKVGKTNDPKRREGEWKRCGRHYIWLGMVQSRFCRKLGEFSIILFDSV